MAEPKRSLRHLLTGEEYDGAALERLLARALELKARRHEDRRQVHRPLEGQTLIELFEKPSLRTHLSFTIAIQELGGSAVVSHAAHRKHEEPEDVAGVLSEMGDAIMIRTHGHDQVERIAGASRIPVINGLSDDHHPCQALADALTLRESFGDLRGLEFAYIGDGNNVLHSLLLVLAPLGVQVRYACPDGYLPSPAIVARANARARAAGGAVTAFRSPSEAVANARAIYTDVWTSMGFEAEKEARLQAFAGYQLNTELQNRAAKDAIMMHCLPMVRGQEITSECADHPRSAIYRQAGNRLHAQKAVLLDLMSQP